MGCKTQHNHCSERTAKSAARSSKPFEGQRMKKRFMLSVVLLLTLTLCGCQRGPNAPSAATRPPDEYVEASIVHQEELNEYLKDKRLLGMLDVTELVILEAHGDRVVVGERASGKQIGEVYYTIQDRWHLKQAHERMEHKPGEGWIIWEQ